MNVYFYLSEFPEGTFKDVNEAAEELEKDLEYYPQATVFVDTNENKISVEGLSQCDHGVGIHRSSFGAVGGFLYFYNYTNY